MAVVTTFYKKRKNPWIGFVLVLLFAPFGFLYNSWKTALLVLFVIGPLWIMFLRHTRFDLIENPWAHYVAVLVLAGFAAVQITGQNNQMGSGAAKGEEPGALQTALSLLPNDVERKAFNEYLATNPKLADKLNNFKFSRDANDPFTAWQIALILSSYGSVQGEAGDLQGASSSFLYSLLFFEDNPSAWAGMAEVYTAWEDKIGARWASRILKFKPQISSSNILNKMHGDPKTISAVEQMKERMRMLIQTCSAHPEWRDSYPLKKNLGIYRNL